MKQVYYWSPYGNVATIKAVFSFIQFKILKNKLTPSLIDACGEWENFKDELLKRKYLLKN